MLQTLHTPDQAARWLQAHGAGDLRADSRQVQAGDGFLAWAGLQVDGRGFVAQAQAQGAAACLVEHKGLSAWTLDETGGPLASYPELKAAAGPIASCFYGEPSRRLSLVAVTGTNGKTSIAWWLAAALNRLARPGLSPCALAGTLGLGVPPELSDQGLTTAGPELLQRRLRDFVQDGVGACALEASSIGLAEHRLDGTHIRVAVFSNFSQDHLDYHRHMETYWQAKQRLFDWPQLEAAVVNLDDARGPALAQRLQERGLDVWTVSLRQAARLQASELRLGEQGLRWTVHEQDRSLALAADVLGEYNVSNLMQVLAVLRALGVPLDAAVQACTGLAPVPGRLERVAAAAGPMVLVDYAHTPDALAQVLRALQPLAERRGGRLYCVFGCGGGRDRGKRPLMAAAAEHGADGLFITSDNPRHEDPQSIIDEIRAGLRAPERAACIRDRDRAIARAVSQAQATDIVLIAGKGHEQTQEIAGVRHPFSDAVQARAALQAWQPDAEGTA